MQTGMVGGLAPYSLFCSYDFPRSFLLPTSSFSKKMEEVGRGGGFEPHPSHHWIHSWDCILSNLKGVAVVKQVL